jgi:hypothetical protein
LSPDAVLLDQFLAYLESRREETQRGFDELTLRRASLSALERNLARASLRTQAAALMDELRRLNLVAALHVGKGELAGIGPSSWQASRFRTASS